MSAARLHSASSNASAPRDGRAGLHTVVTGAGQGIGRAIAIAFAREGARVVLASRSGERLRDTAAAVVAAGGAALPVPTDVRDPEAVQALARTALERWGPPDALVAAAGTAGPSTPTWEVPLAEWEATLESNLTGVFLTCGAFMPSLIEHKAGSIVIVGSVTGKRPLAGRSPYATSKAALVGLTRTLAVEAGPHGVRVNLLSPGPVAGARLDAVLPREAREQWVQATPLRRLTSPEEVAAAARFLCSDAASAITGEDLNVSAGLVGYG